LFHDEYGIIPDIVDGTFALSITENHNRRNCMPESFILLEVATGIGAAIFINSRPLIIGKGLYNEFGHSIFKPDGDTCIAGHKGCLETLASIPAIVKKASLKLGNNDADFDYILNQYLNGNESVLEVVNEAAKWLGVATTNLVNLFSPEEIILSGIAKKFGKGFLDTIEETVKKSAIPAFSKNTSFRLSKLDKDASAHGVALAQLEKFFSNT
jgi:glucokinase